ncbi:hypothetical protein ACLM5J_10405 [Nocardioides sp. Bht2]|uniref:hypothetical protein n=1 Tax=Nocardioides sp. Bht2 TaxID=3392297 RepID=UPI0039B391A1
MTVAMRWPSALPDAVRAVSVDAGEKVLAGAVAADGAVLAGTALALYLVDPVGETRRVGWEQMQRADWNPDDGMLSLSEVGAFGGSRPVYRFAFEFEARFLAFLRERITSTLLLQRHVPVQGAKGLFVIARRAPGGDRAVTWLYEFEEGVDVADPEVLRAAEAALARARDEVGDL